MKLGVDYNIMPEWTVGTTVNWVSSFYYVGDEANLIAPIPGYATVGLHTAYKPIEHLQVFATINNLFNRKYGTWGILSDPTGINAPGVPVDGTTNGPGVPVDGTTNGPGVDNRFLSSAQPFEAFGGVRILF